MGLSAALLFTTVDGNNNVGAPVVKQLPAAAEALGAAPTLAPPPPLYLKPASVASSTSCLMASAISFGGGTWTATGLLSAASLFTKRTKICPLSDLRWIW